MTEEEFIAKFYSCDNEEQFLKDVYHNLNSLEKQLEYLRSGEYLNQLKFERNLLEDIAHNMEVSKEDKEFIDMTHRNTELLEENNQLKEKIEKALIKTENMFNIGDETRIIDDVLELDKILKGVSK